MNAAGGLLGACRAGRAPFLARGWKRGSRSRARQSAAEGGGAKRWLERDREPLFHPRAKKGAPDLLYPRQVVPRQHSLAHPHALSYVLTAGAETGGEPMSERSDPMSERSEPWDDIETLYDAVRVEEEVLLAVMEVLGQLDDSEADEFSWDDFGWAFAYGATSQ